MKGDAVVELTPAELYFLGWYLDEMGFHKLGKKMIKSNLSNYRKRTVLFRMPKWQVYLISRYIIELFVANELFINEDFLRRDISLIRSASTMMCAVKAKRGKRENSSKFLESNDRRTYQRARKRLKERMASSPAATDLGLFEKVATELRL